MKPGDKFCPGSLHCFQHLEIDSRVDHRRAGWGGGLHVLQAGLVGLDALLLSLLDLGSVDRSWAGPVLGDGCMTASRIL